LDCWDSCELELKDKFYPTDHSKFLCYKLNNYFKFKQNHPNLNLDKLVKILKSTDPKRVLFLKGSGNLGIMQNVTKLFFAKYNATFAFGSTCDGIGEKGIIKGRGISHILPTWIIKNSKNIIIWGRNPYVTNIHLLPLIKNKKTITIDVINTKTAKNSDYFYQVNPNSDYFLAILLAQYIIKHNLFINPPTKEYKELVFSYTKNELEKLCGIKDISALIYIIKEGASVLLGLGVAKCKECWKTTWAIDSLFYMMDYFAKEDRGVAFLGSSINGLNNPFDVKVNKVPLFDINLDEFDVVFIQGANPLVSLVNRDEWEKLKDKITIVFGKYFDETAKIAKIFIPTKEFWAKKDIRGSYFNEYVYLHKDTTNSDGISEYELTKYLFSEFNFKGLKSEDEYIKEILGDNEKITDNLYLKKIYKKPPYQDLKFTFLNEKFNYEKKDFYIVTAKNDKSLNSQFIQDKYLYINPDTPKWRDDNLQYKYSQDIPKNAIFAKGGITINKYLKAKGENGYYEI
jgi:anaerobic selenocysteine-containing dehydrogenase